MAARCAHPGCGRFVRRGDHTCHRHRADDAGGRAPPEETAPFVERLVSGDYRSLLDPQVWATVESAGAERGLSGEIGMLRLVLVRLLREEEDPARLAQGASRVASVLVHAARAQRTLSGEAADGFTEAMTQILAEFGGDP